MRPRHQRECFADARRADHFPALRDGRRDDHLEGEFSSGGVQGPDVAAALAPELEVLADENPPHVPRADEPPDELIGAQRRELFGEMEDDHVIRSGLVQQARSVAHIGERGRWCSRRECLDRKRVERHGERSAADFSRAGGRLAVSP